MPLPLPSTLTDNQKKTLHYRYFSNVSPYDASFGSAVLADLPAKYSSEYLTFYNTNFVNNTLIGPYYCPYPYFIIGDATSFQLKTIYDKATTLIDHSNSLKNAIQSGLSNMNYIGTSKPFTSTSNAADNFNDLIQKINLVLTDANNFLSTQIPPVSFSVSSTNIITGNVQVGSGSNKKNIYAEESSYGQYSIYFATNSGDDSFQMYTRDTSSPVSVSVPTNASNYMITLQTVITTFTNLRKNQKFTMVNNAYQPKQNINDKRIDEVIDIIIASLTQASSALKSSYKNINQEKAKAIDANRAYIANQMKELYQLPGSNIDNYKQYYTGTMVAGTIWTVLATSLIYYVFSEL
jgi:hypothetical protein